MRGAEGPVSARGDSPKSGKVNRTGEVAHRHGRTPHRTPRNCRGRSDRSRGRGEEAASTSSVPVDGNGGRGRVPAAFANNSWPTDPNVWGVAERPTSCQRAASHNQRQQEWEALDLRLLPMTKMWQSLRFLPQSSTTSCFGTCRVSPPPVLSINLAKPWQDRPGFLAEPAKSIAFPRRVFVRFDATRPERRRFPRAATQPVQGVSFSHTRQSAVSE